MALKRIFFSEDYEKLPQMWEGSQAVLVAVYPEKMSRLEKDYGAFLDYDTRYRDGEGRYVLDFEDALVLVFIHLATGLPFTTVRKSWGAKFEYYSGSVGERFELVRRSALG